MSYTHVLPYNWIVRYKHSGDCMRQWVMVLTQSSFHMASSSRSPRSTQPHHHAVPVPHDLVLTQSPFHTASPNSTRPCVHAAPIPHGLVLMQSPFHTASSSCSPHSTRPCPHAVPIPHGLVFMQSPFYTASSLFHTTIGFTQLSLSYLHTIKRNCGALYYS